MKIEKTKKTKVMLYIEDDLIKWVKDNLCGEGVTFQEAIRRLLKNMREIHD